MGQATGQPRTGSSALYELAFGEAVRALSEQRAAIESIRNRAGLILTVAAVTTSFLAAQALSGGLRPVSFVALVSFVAVAGLSLAILWPRNWELSIAPSDLIRGYVDAGRPPGTDELHRELAIQMDGSYVRNRVTVAKLATFFQVASLTLIIEVILWIVAITTSG